MRKKMKTRSKKEYNKVAKKYMSITYRSIDENMICFTIRFSE